MQAEVLGKNNLGTAEDFGASAPQTGPQKTGIARPSRRIGQATAAFTLNGKPAGVLLLFLDRVAAFDRGAGRPRGVEGLMDTAPHWPDRVQIGV